MSFFKVRLGFSIGRGFEWDECGIEFLELCIILDFEIVFS